MRLIIHAGVHRTGSTALQRSLAGNRTALALQGFAYPFNKPNHQEIAWALHRRRMRGDDLVARLEPLSRSKAHTIILSAEDFSVHRNLDWIRAVSENYEVGCVLYLRRQDEWLMSWYNQHVKWPFDKWKSKLSPQEFLATIDEFHWIDYESLLDRWSGALGEDHVSIAVVDKTQVVDVVQHFCDRVGIDAATMRLDRGRSNDSLPVHILEIARHLGLFDLKPRERVILNDALRRALGTKASGLTTVYSPAEDRKSVV